MTSYNFLNGIETSENKDLLTNITRGEWGYEGIFMTDWGNNSNHAREVLAGNDVKMPSGSPATLKAALKKGILKRSDLEDATRVHLTISAEDFRGGVRAVIRSRNILIDNSFSTQLKEQYDKFVFLGGDGSA